MVIVLTSVGLPTEDITLIIAVDWFLWVPTKCQRDGDWPALGFCGSAGTKCHRKASDGCQAPTPQRLLMHNAGRQWRTFWLKCVFNRINRNAFAGISPMLPPHPPLVTAWGPQPTSWGTRWGPASSSTFPAKSCSVRILRCAALWSRIKRRPTSWSARRTMPSITQTVRPPCEAVHWFWPSSRGTVELCACYNIYECILFEKKKKKRRRENSRSVSPVLGVTLTLPQDASRQEISLWVSQF